MVNKGLDVSCTRNGVHDDNDGPVVETYFSKVKLFNELGARKSPIQFCHLGSLGGLFTKFHFAPRQVWNKYGTKWNFFIFKNFIKLI